MLIGSDVAALVTPLTFVMVCCGVCYVVLLFIWFKVTIKLADCRGEILGLRCACLVFGCCCICFNFVALC